MALSAAVAASSSGDNTVIPAVAGKKIRVKSWELSNGAASAQSAKWKVNGVDVTGLFYSTAIGPMGDQEVPKDDWLFETPVNVALVLNLSAATAVGGAVEYTLE
jgi:hypothetical protein